MAQRIAEQDFQAILDIAAQHEDGISAQAIRLSLGDVPLRTVQYRLRQLVAADRLVREGGARAARYRLRAKAQGQPDITVPAGNDNREEPPFTVTKQSAEIQRYVRRSPSRRKPAGYQRAFLDSYRPNVTAYLSPGERAHLHKVGNPGHIEAQPAGTYAKQILSRLLIDLSWNSSRLEGNTYSLIDTRRLIAFGQSADGKNQVEAQMILNHKDAIEFLVSDAHEIGFNRYTLLNLHAMLANNLLADPGAAGRLRHIGVGIEQSVFHPLEVPQLIDECFDQILACARAISDPFEQSFFVMVQLPYLQPFDDVNKRVSRLAANIPFIRANLVPLSFTDVPRQIYMEAVLGIYEMNRVDLLKDVYIWAYERSAARYSAARHSLGEPDPFRIKYRTALRELVAGIVRGAMHREEAAAYLSRWTDQHVDVSDGSQFRETAESELLSLHEGNFARYQIRPSEFEAWRKTWGNG